MRMSHFPYATWHQVSICTAIARAITSTIAYFHPRPTMLYDGQPYPVTLQSRTGIIAVYTSIGWALPLTNMISWSTSSRAFVKPVLWMTLLTLNARLTNHDQGYATYSMYMILLQFYTGEYHPLAHHPRIDVQHYERGQHVMLEIAGDNIALLVDTYRTAQLFIFDWKTGHKRLVCWRVKTWRSIYRDRYVSVLQIRRLFYYL